MATTIASAEVYVGWPPLAPGAEEELGLEMQHEVEPLLGTLQSSTTTPASPNKPFHRLSSTQTPAESSTLRDGLNITYYAQYEPLDLPHADNDAGSEYIDTTFARLHDESEWPEPRILEPSIATPTSSTQLPSSAEPSNYSNCHGDTTAMSVEAPLPAAQSVLHDGSSLPVTSMGTPAGSLSATGVEPPTSPRPSITTAGATATGEPKASERSPITPLALITSLAGPTEPEAPPNEATAPFVLDATINQGTATLPEQHVITNGADGLLQPFLPLNHIGSGVLDASIFTTIPNTNTNGLHLDPPFQEDFQMPLPESQAQPAERPSTSAFAKLVFSDGDFYMKSLSVELGRDDRILQQAKAKERQRKRRGSTSDEVHTPKRRKRDAYYSRGPRSHIGSEAGGIVASEINSQDGEQQSRESQRSPSPSAAAPQDLMNTPKFDYQNAAVDASMGSAPKPDGWEPLPSTTVRVPIHPPRTEEHFDQLKKISRVHAKIDYNYLTGCFELQVVGTNGLFVNNEFHPRGQTHSLSHGDDILIAAVEFKFFLPDPEPDYVEDFDDDEMSFNFEDSRGASIRAEEETDEENEPPAEQTRGNEVWFTEEMQAGYEIDTDDSSDHAEISKANPRHQKQKLKLKFNSKKHAPLLKHKHTALSKHKDKRVENRKKAEKLKKPKKSRPPPEEEPVQSIEEPVLPTKEKQSTPPKLSAKEEPVSESVNPLAQAPAVPATPEGNRFEGNTLVIGAAGVEFKALQGGDENEGTCLPPEEADRLGVDRNVRWVRKKGPGRPPKDGIMSKREKGLLVRALKERQKAEREGRDPNEAAVMPQPKPPAQSRTDSEAHAVEDAASKSDAATSPTVPRKPVKQEKPERNASPVRLESDFTEEQLAKPTKNYVEILGEVLATGPKHLQEIYKDMEKRYPYFKFRTGTHGWQSSVRHNLLQAQSFEKVETAGSTKKDHPWRLNPEFPIEKIQRKRVASPPRQQGGYYPQPGGPYAVQPNMHGYPQPGQLGPAPIPGQSGQSLHPGQASGQFPRPAPPANPVINLRIPSSLRQTGAPPTASHVSPWASGGAAPPVASPYGAPASSSRPSPYGPVASPYGPQANTGPAPSPYGPPPRSTSGQPSTTSPAAGFTQPVNGHSAPQSHTPPGPAPVPSGSAQTSSTTQPQQNAPTAVMAPQPLPHANGVANSGTPSSQLGATAHSQQSSHPQQANSNVPREHASNTRPPSAPTIPRASPYPPPPLSQPPIPLGFRVHTGLANTTTPPTRPALASPVPAADSPLRPDVEPLTPPVVPSRPHTAGGDAAPNTAFSPSRLTQQLDAIRDPKIIAERQAVSEESNASQNASKAPISASLKTVGTPNASAPAGEGSAQPVTTDSQTSSTQPTTGDNAQSRMTQ